MWIFDLCTRVCEMVEMPCNKKSSFDVFGGMLRRIHY
jgi:hypothetical protein